MFSKQARDKTEARPVQSSEQGDEKDIKSEVTSEVNN